METYPKKKRTDYDYGKPLLTRLNNNKSASDFRIPPSKESILDDLRNEEEGVNELICHYMDANTALIDENIKLKKQNEYLQLVLGELRKSFQNTDDLI